MSRECGVVTAAMFCMKYQCHIQHRRFQLGVLAVRMKHLKQIFCQSQLRFRIPDDQIVALEAMAVCVVAVYG